MEDCLFCKIAAHQEPAKIIDETADIIVIENKFPKAPVHVLVMPKRHYSKQQVHFADQGKLYDQLLQKCGEVAQKMGLADGNYKIIINGSKVGHFDHEHLHLLGGWASGAVPEVE